jgi:CrcB protein
MMKLVWLAAAGALGTLARYGLTGLVHRVDGVSFPWGTLTVNVLGCFLAGLLWTLFEGHWPVSAETRVVVMVGFMGAFTTFSAYAVETGELLRSAEWTYAAANVIFNNVIGLGALLAGRALARMI